MNPHGIGQHENADSNQHSSENEENACARVANSLLINESDEGSTRDNQCNPKQHFGSNRSIIHTLENAAYVHQPVKVRAVGGIFNSIGPAPRANPRQASATADECCRI